MTTLKMTVPRTLRAEHRELQHELTRAMQAGGRTGEAARRVADLLHPHFVKEEEFALPPLAVLAALAKGIPLPDPGGVLERTERLKAIADAKAEIERRAAERYAQEKEAYDKNLAERAAKELKTGKKPGGPKPQPPTPGVRGKDQVNLTDGESRIMKKSGGGFEQAYNAQAGVDTESMMIVTSHVSQQTNDKRELEPAVANLMALPESLGTVDAVLTDNGFYSETNVGACENKKITPYIAFGRDQHNQPLMDRFREPLPLPNDADAVTRMKHRLRTQAGKKIYAKRKSTVEPVFGIIKAVMGFRQFLLRGFESVQGEWDLVCIAWNLKRLHSLS